MDLPAFVATVRRHWQLVTACFVVGLLAGLGLSLAATPMFESTARMFLATPGWNPAAPGADGESSPYRGNEFSRQRALTYVRLATDPDLAGRVVTQLGEHLDPGELAAHTSAHVVPDTVLLEVSVRDSSAVRAQRLAGAVAAELATEIRGMETPSGSLIPTVEPVLTRAPEVAAKPAEPRVWITLLLAATTGLVLGVTVAVARELAAPAAQEIPRRKA